MRRRAQMVSAMLNAPLTPTIIIIGAPSPALRGLAADWMCDVQNAVVAVSLTYELDTDCIDSTGGVRQRGGAKPGVPNQPACESLQAGCWRILMLAVTSWLAVSRLLCKRGHACMLPDPR